MKLKATQEKHEIQILSNHFMLRMQLAAAMLRFPICGLGHWEHMVQKYSAYGLSWL